MFYLAVDCSDVVGSDGVYNILVSGIIVEVFCDMSTPGGGWLVSILQCFTLHIFNNFGPKNNYQAGEFKEIFC